MKDDAHVSPFRESPPTESRELRVFTPQRPQWIKAGAIIFGSGYLGALIAVIVMAHGTQEWKEIADFFHRGMLFVMLVGMLTVFAGYRRWESSVVESEE